MGVRRPDEESGEVGCCCFSFIGAMALLMPLDPNKPPSVGLSADEDELRVETECLTGRSFSRSFNPFSISFLALRSPTSSLSDRSR